MKNDFGIIKKFRQSAEHKLGQSIYLKSVEDMLGSLKDYPVNDTKSAIRHAYIRKYLR